MKLFDGETLKGWVAEDGVLSLKEQGGGDNMAQIAFDQKSRKAAW